LKKRITRAVEIDQQPFVWVEVEGVSFLHAIHERPKLLTNESGSSKER